jgi:Phosphotransferase enzyme family
MHPALEALRDGDLEALAATYLSRAKLELSVPGERVRGEAAEALRERFRSGVAAEQFSAREWPEGAAVTLQRGAWRQRHYLRFSSAERVAAHWVYAAGVVPERGEIPAPPVAGDARPVGGGNSGAALWRVLRPDGSLVVVKQVGAESDWVSRAVGGGTRSADLFRAGILGRLPEPLDSGVLDAVADGSTDWLVMRDVSASLLGDERRLSREESRGVLEAAAAMHDRFWGESVPSLAACGDRLVIAGPATWERERDGHDLLPKQAPVAWDAFFGTVDDDVAGAVRGLLADPSPLVERLTRRGTTLIHGDLRDDNLAFADGRIVLLDWDLATAGTPADEFAWYLLHDAWRIDATREEIVADWRAAEGARVDDEDEALMALAGLVLYGWILGHSAVIHPDPAEQVWAEDELAWWVPRAREALGHITPG